MIKHYRKDIKLGIRYIILGIFIYMSWYTIQPEWISSVKDMNGNALASIYVSINAALTMMLKSHFETKIENEKNYDEKDNY